MSESDVSETAERDESAIAVARTDAAARYLKEGNRDAALAECQAVLTLSEVGAHSAARVSEILRAIGQTKAADQVRDMVVDRLEQEIRRHPEDPQLLGLAGRVNEYLGRAERGEALLQKALRLDPTDPQPGLSLTCLYLSRDDPAAARAIWGPVLNVADDPGLLLLVLAKVFGQFGFLSEAEAILGEAEPLCTQHRTKFEIAAAGIRGDANRVDQHAMAVNVFDDFADTYDDVLAVLDNSGPALVKRMIEEIGLAADGSRRVLDAGCGTGLCAGLLRPYASHLAGADISPKMLAKAGEKGVYDTLTRTDLSVPFTFPEGRFDLVVSSDVMVYFGDLRPAFANIFDCLTPGGWFVFTVERAEEADAPLGHRINASGRFGHTRKYLIEVLSDCRFVRPRQIFSDVIRMEMREPITAYVVAAQKPALFRGR